MLDAMSHFTGWRVNLKTLKTGSFGGVYFIVKGVLVSIEGEDYIIKNKCRRTGR